MKVLRLAATALPGAVLVGYFALLADQTGFACIRGAYIGMAAIGLLLASPLTGALAALAAALWTTRHRGWWAAGAFAVGSVGAWSTIALVWEFTPLGGCYT